MNPHRRAFITSLVLLAAAGAVAGTSASFNARTTNEAAFSTDALNNPSNVVATVAGNTVGWSWTAGNLTSGGSSFIHRLSTKALAAGTLAGVAPACAWSDATWPTTSTIPNATTSTTIATAAGNAGAWLCWRLDVQHPAASPIWFSQSSPTGSVKIGHAMATVAVTNGGVSGRLDPGDVMVITFTQPVVKTTGPDLGNPSANSVCVYRSGGTHRIYVGRTKTPTTACSNSETLTVGSITTGLTVGGAITSVYNATYTWGGACTNDSLACTQLTMLVGSRTSGTADQTTALSSALFDPTTETGKLKSSSGDLSICTTTNNTGTPVVCHPQITGSF